MKKIIYLSAVFAITFFIEGKAQSTKSESAILEYFGEKIDGEGAISSTKLATELSENDSIKVKIKGEIIEVCTKKGCWMTLDMGNDELITVRFKDYGFFMPKDSHGKWAVIEGVAKKELVDVKTLQHYAEDAGKSKEEIEKITEDEVGYTFLASGVIIGK